MPSLREWQRSGDRNTDLLHLYLTGEMYDCSFNVGCSESTYKIFKCHKLILSVASPVFQTMFHGHFQESKKGSDDPVLIENVSPEAFDIAMRYIYSYEKDFPTVSLAIEVYKFAHEMLLENLVADAGKFLHDVGPEDFIPVYNLFKLTENEQGLKNCRAKMSTNTASCLNSSCWVTATEETVQDVLGLNELDVTEFELFHAIEKWGIAQMGTEDDISDLRTVVGSCFKLIRFMTIDYKELGKLCISTKLLTTEEKYLILLSSSQNDSKLLPEQFDRSILNRLKNHVAYFGNQPLYGVRPGAMVGIASPNNRSGPQMQTYDQLQHNSRRESYSAFIDR